MREDKEADRRSARAAVWRFIGDHSKVTMITAVSPVTKLLIKADLGVVFCVAFHCSVNIWVILHCPASDMNRAARVIKHDL